MVDVVYYGIEESDKPIQWIELMRGELLHRLESLINNENKYVLIEGKLVYLTADILETQMRNIYLEEADD